MAQDRPIVSLLAGYQSYFVKDKTTIPVLYKKDSRLPKTYLSLYKREEKDKYRQGEYIGNRITAYYIPNKRDLGTLNTVQGMRLGAKLQSTYTAKGTELMQNVAKSFSNKLIKGVNETINNLKPYPAAEEQTLKPGKKLASDKGVGGNPFDLLGPKGEFMNVTAQTLSNPKRHHGLYGVSHQKMLGEITKINEKYKGKSEMDEKRHQEIADEGLRYFKGRLPQWNSALMRIQKGHGVKTAMAPKAIRTNIADATAGTGMGISIEGATADSLNKIAGATTGFFDSSAAELTQQHLANAGQVDKNRHKGVTYTFVIDDFAHVAIQRLHMGIDSKGKYRWFPSKLKHAEVIYGMMASLGSSKIKDRVNQNIDTVVKRVHGTVATSADANKQSTTTMKTFTAGTAGLTTERKSFAPTIDMIHADKSLSLFLKTKFLKQLRKQTKNFKFNNQIHRAERHKFEDGYMWAAPYITLTDYTFQSFGIK